MMGRLPAGLTSSPWESADTSTQALQFADKDAQAVAGFLQQEEA